MSPPAVRTPGTALPSAGPARPCTQEAGVLPSAAEGHLYYLTVHGSAAGFVDLRGERPSYPRSEWVFSALCLGWIAPSSRGSRLQITDAGRIALAELDDAPPSSVPNPHPRRGSTVPVRS
ncbi:hypothetical protein [Streptomyces sp. bgisy154]|uniref:hypothetical protein n=1 Tax=Streptomyces sp. bgisy154 TaxID=3413794 RepID=UPI003D736398